MKPLTNYPVRVFSTGVVVVTLLSIALFWLRFACRVSLSETMPDDIKDVSIEPSGFLPDDFEKDPNVTRRSRVSATMRSEPLLTLGIIDYSESMSPGGRPSNLFFAEGQDKWAYFDQESGQIICRYTETAIMPDKDRLHRIVQCYIGPDAISELPGEELGCFIEPIVDRSRLGRSLEWAGLILYDKKLRRFFKVDFKQKTVFKGPALGTDDAREPVQIGQLDKNSSLLHLKWWPPQTKAWSGDADEISAYAPSGLTVPGVVSSSDGSYLPVLDKTGRIDLLVADVVLPKMDGRALARQLERERPGLRVLYMSGSSDDALSNRDVFDNEVTVLQKPFTPPELLRKIRSVLASPAPESEGE